MNYKESLQGYTAPSRGEYGEHNVIHNSKLDRVMYYMLLHDSDEVEFDEISYIFSANMNTTDIIRVIESDLRNRFYIKHDGEEVMVGLSDVIKLRGDDQLTYIIRLAERWKNEIFKHLQHVTASALSVICTDIPRPSILPKDLKMRDLLMSDKQKRFSVYGSVDFTEVSINEDGVKLETETNTWRNSIAALLRNMAQSGEGTIAESLLLTRKPIPSFLAEQGCKASEILSVDPLCRFTVNGVFDKAIGKPSSYAVSFRFTDETDAKIKSYLDEWRKKMYLFLQAQESTAIDISTVGALVTRPPGLPSSVKLRQVLANDPTKRFQLFCGSNFTTVSVNKRYGPHNGGSSKAPSAPNVAEGGAQESSDGWIKTGTGKKQHRPSGHQSGTSDYQQGSSQGWPAYSKRGSSPLQGKTGTARGYDDSYHSNPNHQGQSAYGHSSPNAYHMGGTREFKERLWDREIIRDLPQAAQLRQMQSYERNKPYGVKLLGFMSAVSSAIGRCRSHGLTTEGITSKIWQCEGSTDKLKDIFPSARMLATDFDTFIDPSRDVDNDQVTPCKDCSLNDLDSSDIDATTRGDVSTLSTSNESGFLSELPTNAGDISLPPTPNALSCNSTVGNNSYLNTTCDSYNSSFNLSPFPHPIGLLSGNPSGCNNSTSSNGSLNIDDLASSSHMLSQYSSPVASSGIPVYSSSFLDNGFSGFAMQGATNSSASASGSSGINQIDNVRHSLSFDDRPRRYDKNAHTRRAEAGVGADTSAYDMINVNSGSVGPANSSNPLSPNPSAQSPSSSSSPFNRGNAPFNNSPSELYSSSRIRGNISSNIGSNISSANISGPSISGNGTTTDAHRAAVTVTSLPTFHGSMRSWQNYDVDTTTGAGGNNRTDSDSHCKVLQSGSFAAAATAGAMHGSGSESSYQPLTQRMDPVSPAPSSPLIPPQLHAQAQVTGTFKPNQEIGEFFRFVFGGFPAQLIDSFTSKFNNEGFIQVQDLVIAQDLGQLKHVMLSSGFKLGHVNRLVAALCEVTSGTPTVSP